MGNNTDSDNVNTKKAFKRLLDREDFRTAAVVFLLLVVIALLLEGRQGWAIQGSIPNDPAMPPATAKETFEIAKLKAEIQQIRSDTSGSLFWLKLIAVFVTVGGAVGGYLLAQTKTSRERIEFEDRKNVDAVYQAIVQDLSNESALLRAAAVVKLGSVLQSFPSEWKITDPQKQQMKQLTKQILAAALATESDLKVLKTTTIAIALDRSLPARKVGEKNVADLRELDLSTVKADDAYWADIDFSSTDFYKANLVSASFRRSVLTKSQFREANLSKAVFNEADCSGTSFKLADLRDASFVEATFSNVDFEMAKVHGVRIDINAIKGSNLSLKVDNSPFGDGSDLITVEEWLNKVRETGSNVGVSGTTQPKHNEKQP